MMFSDRNKTLEALIIELRGLEKNHNEFISKYNSLVDTIKEREKKIQEVELNLKKDFEKRNEKIQELERNLTREYEIKCNNLKSEREALKRIFEEKSKGFPWLSRAISQYYKYIDNEIADHLRYKNHPAIKTSDQIQQIAKEKALLKTKLLIAENFVNYYETLFPWLTDYVGDNLDDLLNSLTEEEEKQEFDPVLNFIQKAEYEKLSEEERNQKALDRYINSAKKPWQIGRDYERYIGFKFESLGYKVVYQGIVKGLEDLGRDLICTKGNEILIIQCKCWARHKTIHEKHINQLYGTAVKYYIENVRPLERRQELILFPDLIKSKVLRAIFITSTMLSQTALNFAEALGIEVYQEEHLVKYPMIKCNIGADGTKIYHLPFDQQYDRTEIISNGEFYANTVKEAMNKGFRRAFRWKGSNIN